MSPEEQYARLSGVQKEKHHAIVNAITKDLVRSEQKTDFARLLDRASAIKGELANYATLLDDLARNNATVRDAQTKELLMKDVGRRSLEKFNEFNREELLLLLSFNVAMNVVEGVR